METVCIGSALIVMTVYYHIEPLLIVGLHFETGTHRHIEVGNKEFCDNGKRFELSYVCITMLLNDP